MSEGPIRQWRDGFKAAQYSTPQSSALHAASGVRDRAYCGRRTTALTNERTLVTCTDCVAAWLADERELWPSR